jgi:hypothetical protein
MVHTARKSFRKIISYFIVIFILFTCAIFVSLPNNSNTDISRQGTNEGPTNLHTAIDGQLRRQSTECPTYKIEIQRRNYSNANEGPIHENWITPSPMGSTVVNCNLVLAIFSVAHLTEDRLTIRSSTIAYYNQVKQKYDCKISLVFVLGRVLGADRDTIDREQSLHADLVQLDIEENMNQGKTFAWFEYASIHYPNATWIGKSDMDTFVRYDMLAERLSSIPTKSLYAGIIVHHLGCNIVDGRSVCVNGWVFMSGQLYFVSVDLVQWIASPENAITRKNVNGLEDVLTGKWLHESGIDMSYHALRYRHDDMIIHEVKDISKFHTLLNASAVKLR